MEDEFYPWLMYNYKETIFPTKDNFSNAFNQISLFPGIPPHNFSQPLPNTTNLYYYHEFEDEDMSDYTLEIAIRITLPCNSTLGKVNKEKDTFSFYLIGVIKHLCYIYYH